jgi:hypothetical protein
MNAQDKPPAGPALQASVAAFGLLPGEFAIRTSLKDYYLTARNGGRHSIDAVITAATAVAGSEKFKLTSFQPDFTTIQTLRFTFDRPTPQRSAGPGESGRFAARAAAFDDSVGNTMRAIKIGANFALGFRANKACWELGGDRLLERDHSRQVSDRE